MAMADWPHGLPIMFGGKGARVKRQGGGPPGRLAGDPLDTRGSGRIACKRGRPGLLRTVVEGAAIMTLIRWPEQGMAL